MSAGAHPGAVRDALRLVRGGAVYELGHRLGDPGTAGAASFRMSWPDVPAGTQAGFACSVETVEATLHAGTHIDGLAHVIHKGRIFGGTHASAALGPNGWRSHGMETAPPIICRCVIADVAAAAGAPLADGYEITIEDLRAAGVATSLPVRPGDAILVRTGKGPQFSSDPDAYNGAQPGVGVEAAAWLADAGMSVLGTDTGGTGVSPAPAGSPDVHVAMIVDRGVFLIESLALEEICEDGVREALFIALPLKVVGGTGSWLRPIAVV